MNQTRFSFNQFHAYLPSTASVLFFWQDGKAECGYNTFPRFKCLYRVPLKEYLSLGSRKPGMNTHILTLEGNKYQFISYDLYNYFHQLLKGHFDLSYPLYSETTEYCQILDQNLMNQFRAFAFNCNRQYPYKQVKKLIDQIRKKLAIDRFRNRYARFGLHIFRGCLFAERLLRNDPFPSPNLIDLKIEHRFESMIDLLIDCNNTKTLLGEFQYTKLLNQISILDAHLASLARTKMRLHFTHNQLVTQGNDLLFSLLGLSKSFMATID